MRLGAFARGWATIFLTCSRGGPQDRGWAEILRMSSWHSFSQRSPRLQHADLAKGRDRNSRHMAGTPLAHPVGRVQILHHRAAPRRRHHFFESTSCSIVLSSVSSATSRFSRAFSSCSCLHWRIWSVSSPLYCFFQRYNVCSLIPTCRISSATGTPSSSCFNTATIWSTENRLRFIRQNPPSSDFAENSLSIWINFRGADHFAMILLMGN